MPFKKLIWFVRCPLAVSRRRFLHHGVLAAAACAASPLLAFSSRRPTGGDEPVDRSRQRPSSGADDWQNHASALDHIDRNAFAGAVGTAFKVYSSNSQPVWLTLQAVDDLPKLATVNPASFAVASKSSGFAPASSGFFLVFGSSAQLPQDTHLFEHDSLGRFALFTVPEPNGTYVAVVNRVAGNVIAVPYNKGQAAPAGPSAAGASGGFSAPATSSGTENLSPGLSEIPIVRRGGVRD
jgi:hypothetical protein